MNFERIHFSLIGSTNDDAATRARAGAGEGVVITAVQQEVGRGRQGRVWQSPPGNLFTSIVLRPRVPSSLWGQLAFVVALAVGETIGNFTPDWRLKWPNDVLVNGAKISGILLESEPGWIVAGIGINVQHRPPVTDREVTSLAELGATAASPASVLDLLLNHLNNWYDLWQSDGFAPIRRAWLSHAQGLGGPITVALADGQRAEGLFETLDSDGALLLRLPEGQLQRIMTGDVFFS